MSEATALLPLAKTMTALAVVAAAIFMVVFGWPATFDNKRLGWLVLICYLTFILIRLVLDKSAPFVFSTITKDSPLGERAIAIVSHMLVLALALHAFQE